MRRTLKKYPKFSIGKEKNEKRIVSTYHFFLLTSDISDRLRFWRQNALLRTFASAFETNFEYLKYRRRIPRSEGMRARFCHNFSVAGDRLSLLFHQVRVFEGNVIRFTKLGRNRLSLPFIYLFGKVLSTNKIEFEKLPLIKL